MRELLSARKTAILDRWFAVALESYPAETLSFLKSRDRQFANPVGYALYQGLESLWEALVLEQEPDIALISPVLDSIVRIRAIQGLPPSQALAFLVHLKKLVREELGISNTVPSERLRTLESRIDFLVLASFDVYMKCREKVYELKADEARRETYRLTQMANRACESRK